jgi:soluble lytic murein transglycosylase-like protein
MKNVNFKTAIFLWFLVIFGGVGLAIYGVNRIEEQSKEQYLEEMGGEPNSPVCLKMYNSIEKYSKKYKIPKYIAYNVAYRETRYQGPFDWSYTPIHISTANAVGPMQIITRWAHQYAGRHVSQNELLTNVDLNVLVSMKMLRRWYDMHHSWALACGGYNTGSPIINEYAHYCATNKNYKSNWIKYSR